MSEPTMRKTALTIYSIGVSTARFGQQKRDCYMGGFWGGCSP